MKKIFKYIFLLLSIIVILYCGSKTRENLVNVNCLTQCLESQHQIELVQSSKLTN